MFFLLLFFKAHFQLMFVQYESLYFWSVCFFSYLFNALKQLDPAHDWTSGSLGGDSILQMWKTARLSVYINLLADNGKQQQQ